MTAAILAFNGIVGALILICCTRIALTPSNHNPTRNTPDEIREQAGRGFHGEAR